MGIFYFDHVIGELRSGDHETTAFAKNDLRGHFSEVHVIWRGAHQFRGENSKKTHNQAVYPHISSIINTILEFIKAYQNHMLLRQISKYIHNAEKKALWPHFLDGLLQTGCLYMTNRTQGEQIKRRDA
jgi:hypothetical protein